MPWSSCRPSCGARASRRPPRPPDDAPGFYEACPGAGDPQGKRLGRGAPVEHSKEEQLLWREGSNSAVTMELSEPVVENGEVEMVLEES